MFYKKSCFSNFAIFTGKQLCWSLFLNWQFWFFFTEFTQKRVLPVWNGKSEHHHRILQNQNSLLTSFQLKLTSLIFFFYQIFPKNEFPVQNGKIALVRASMVVTYYIKLFRTAADRNNDILMYLLLLVAETITKSVLLIEMMKFFNLRSKFIIS